MQMRLSPTVKILLIACAVVFLIQQTTDQFFGGHLLSVFGLIPRGFLFEGKIWQIFTYSFLHSDPLDLILNMMMLAFVASDLEFQWGRKRFLQYYFFCAVSAGLLQLLHQLWLRRGRVIERPMLGASGAVSACLVASDPPSSRMPV